jgi:hypothetical protein
MEGWMSNVVEFPTPNKTLAPEEVGQFAYDVCARVLHDRSNPLDVIYRGETVRIDPDAPLEDNCLVVCQIVGAQNPYVMPWWKTGRDYRSRFVPEGHPNECFIAGGCRYAANERLHHIIRILGRVVRPVSASRAAS